ncbi:hypothetical protein ABIC83_002735 [Roseateles asaccharophilus]|uniref:hypothetical protein n=1 Tax=Roseateles asaccharophilus TaxID=582607 RepID=UPI003836C9D7
MPSDTAGLPVVDPDKGADHGETLELFWKLAQDPNRRDVVGELAALCVALAELHAPCERNGERDFAIRRFLKATWAPAYAAEATRIFEAYVRHGVIDVNRELHSRGAIGTPPLAIAIVNGHIEVAELLVKHGARLDTECQGMDMPTLAERMFGEFTVNRPSTEACLEAAARLRQAAMERQIALGRSESSAMGLDRAQGLSGDPGDSEGSKGAPRRQKMF